MGNESLAWVIIAAMAIFGGVALWLLLRRISAWAIKLPLVVGVVLFFATPAPVPDYENDYAPAFVVAIFEAFFQIDGKPDAAVIILCLSLGVGMVLAGLLGYFLRRAK